MADKQSKATQHQPGQAKQTPVSHRPHAMYPGPSNYAMMTPTPSTMMPPPSFGDKRPAPQAGPPRSMYSLPMAGRYPVPPPYPSRHLSHTSPYMRQPMGQHPLMNQYHVASTRPSSAGSTRSESSVKQQAHQPSQKQPIHSQVKSTPKAEAKKIVGHNKPTLVDAKTPMDVVQPVPSFSSRPPRWTETEVSI